MKKKIFVISSIVFIIIIAGCTSVPSKNTTAPEVKETVHTSPATIDFGSIWTGVIRMEKETKTDLGDNAEAQFYSEWTLGENAGNVYPKVFTSSKMGNNGNMEFLWDNGGVIKAGTYDVVVDIDGMPGTGTVKNLKLEKGIVYNVYISFNAAKIDVNLETDNDDIYVYPSGTYDKYKGLGRLDGIPEELLISHVNSYTEKNQIYWLIPAGIPIEIFRTYSNGDSKWFKDFTASPESFVRQFQ